jgi:hypothetical protein
MKLCRTDVQHLETINEEPHERFSSMRIMTYLQSYPEISLDIHDLDICHAVAKRQKTASSRCKQAIVSSRNRRKLVCPETLVALAIKHSIPHHL